MKLLEHPWVIAKRRELEGRVSGGQIQSYTNLRWSLEAGVTYKFVPRYPIRFLKWSVSL